MKWDLKKNKIQLSALMNLSSTQGRWWQFCLMFQVAVGPNQVGMGRSGYTCVRHVFCSLNVLMWVSSLETSPSHLHVNCFDLCSKDGQAFMVFLNHSRIFTFHIAQTSSWVHPTSYPTGTWVLSWGVNLQRREADNSPPTKWPGQENVDL
jgi:hypothetical protein